MTKITDFIKSVWFFPVLITVALLLATVFRINGSSLGVYHPLTGNTSKDSARIINPPRGIRSDEWVVNTPFTVAQKENGFKKVNQNLGNGQDMSVILDVPYKEWSEVFKPHNLAFFVLPFDNAFAFKWWFMAYALLMGCYFLVLALLPGKKLIAIGLSIALLFSAFIQWWYQYITLGPVYYSIWLCLLSIWFFRATRTRYKIALAGVFSYLATCFALVLYPPFQIPCLLIAGLFIVGVAIQSKRTVEFRKWLRSVGYLGAACCVTLLCVALFVFTRSSVVHTINSTAYPGKRVVASGGYDPVQLLSGEVGYQFVFDQKAAHYVAKGGISNQSEASSFVFIGLFTIIPSLYFYAVAWNKTHWKNLDIPHVLVIAGTVILLAWLFIPHLSLLGKLLFLDKVPLNRAIIGLGLANLLLTVQFVKQLVDTKPVRLTLSVAYVTAILLLCLFVSFRIHTDFPDFLGRRAALAFALPLPIITYCLMRKRFITAVAFFTLFSVFIGIRVNPLYHGTAVLTKSPIISAIEHTPNATSGRWITDVSFLENFPLMAGVPSLAGVYDYPQNQLWKPIDNGQHSEIYNRYAHVTFLIDRDTQKRTPTSLLQPGADHFAVVTDPCSNFLRNSHVTFILTTAPINDSCVSLVDQVKVSATAYFIYREN